MFSQVLFILGETKTLIEFIQIKLNLLETSLMDEYLRTAVSFGLDLNVLLLV